MRDQSSLIRTFVRSTRTEIMGKLMLNNENLNGIVREEQGTFENYQNFLNILER